MSTDDARLPAPSPPHVGCPACGEHGLTDVFRMPTQPSLVGRLYDRVEEARSAATGDVSLAFCHSCGLVHNRTFDPCVVDFAPGYEVSLAHSSTFVAFVDQLSRRLVERYELEGRRVLEIGCGGGYFMRLLARRGIGEGIGIDPTLRSSSSEQYGGARLSWVQGLFDPVSYRKPTPDFVCCLSVFESVSRPADFLTGLHHLLVDRKTPVYFEVFNAAHAFEQEETWSIHYEQSNYFDLSSFVGLFERCGFQILEAGPCYEGDQYLYVEAVPVMGAAGSADSERHALPGALRDFAEKHERTVHEWEARLNGLAEVGKKVVLWGTGGKGISFLNTVSAASLIHHVVDINPDRQGQHMPTTGQLIVPPEALVELRPDAVVITNPLYAGEIRDQVAALGLTVEFLAA